MKKEPSDVSFETAMYGLATAALAFLTAPTIVVLVASLNSAESLRFPPTGVSLRWYLSLLREGEVWETALTSLQLAAATTVATVLLGVPAALALSNARGVWLRIADALVMSPLALPGLAVGLGILVWCSMIGMRIDFAVLLASHIVICVPLVVRSSLASLGELGSSYGEASSSLGASHFYGFRNVTLPLIRQGVVSGAFIAFLSSFDNLTVSLFLSSARSQVLPIQMWSMMENSLDVRVAAVAGLVVVSTAIMMIAGDRLFGLSRKVG